MSSRIIWLPPSVVCRQDTFSTLAGSASGEVRQGVDDDGGCPGRSLEVLASRRAREDQGRVPAEADRAGDVGVEAVADEERPAAARVPERVFQQRRRRLADDL